MTASSKRALVKLSNTVDSTVASIHPDSLPTFIKHKHRKKNNTNDDEVDVTTFINGLPPLPKGKATKQSTLTPNSKELQPRIRDYNGQGLVRPSLYLPLNDVSFVPKLEMEFAEHVEGFFGKAKTKAAKKQADENMLWKRCLEVKKTDEIGGGGGGKKRKKKKIDLEAVIRQGAVM